MNLSHHFKQTSPNSPLLGTFVLVDEFGDNVFLETRDERKMRGALKSHGLLAPEEMSNRNQQWTFELVEASVAE